VLASRLDTTDAEKQEELVVLVATGSFSPVPKMHVRMFDIARKHLIK